MKYIQNDTVVFPSTSLAFTFNAFRSGKEQELAQEVKNTGAEVETFQDSKGTSRMRRKPVAVSVPEYKFSEKQIAAILENQVRAAIRDGLQLIHFEEVNEEDLAELLDSQLFTSGGSSVSLGKEEREALADSFNDYLEASEVAEKGRQVLTQILKYGASDSKLEIFGNWEAQKDRVRAGCAKTVERLQGFIETIEGIEAVYVTAVIERIKNYAENGPKKAKKEADILEAI